MKDFHSAVRQRGVSAWTLAGALFLMAGVAGLGVALFDKPGSQALGVASTTATGGVGKPVDNGAAPVEAPKIANPGFGPHPSWYGTWRGATPDASFAITASGVGDCKWIAANEPKFASDCESGYAKASVSLAEIARRYEQSVSNFQRDPSDFKISDPAQTRRMIARIKPGNYRVVWTQSGGDCGNKEMILDGDLILSIDSCKYGHSISLYTRDAASPSAQGQAPQTGSNIAAASRQFGGRWQGAINQAGYPSYPAVLQLQSNAAGVPIGTMTYPSLGCTASLTFARMGGTAAWFTESIQQGQGKCQDGGQISIDPIGDGAMAWKYFVPGNLKAPVATATFRR